ncbi:hypothetical protein MPSEU_000220000 [Mayamaea pseudoterrestris]|nr:hypothetical protein MPSEU_000220000 [Mayamaea pseudoterrestris]
MSSQNSPKPAILVPKGGEATGEHGPKRPAASSMDEQQPAPKRHQSSNGETAAKHGNLSTFECANCGNKVDANMLVARCIAASKHGICRRCDDDFGVLEENQCPLKVCRANLNVVIAQETCVDNAIAAEHDENTLEKRIVVYEGAASLSMTENTLDDLFKSPPPSSSTSESGSVASKSGGSDVTCNDTTFVLDLYSTKESRAIGDGPDKMAPTLDGAATAEGGEATSTFLANTGVQGDADVAAQNKDLNKFGNGSVIDASSIEAPAPTNGDTGSPALTLKASGRLSLHIPCQASLQDLINSRVRLIKIWLRAAEVTLQRLERLDKLCDDLLTCQVFYNMIHERLNGPFAHLLALLNEVNMDLLREEMIVNRPCFRSLRLELEGNKPVSNFYKEFVDKRVDCKLAIAQTRYLCKAYLQEQSIVPMKQLEAFDKNLQAVGRAVESLLSDITAASEELK